MLLIGLMASLKSTAQKQVSKSDIDIKRFGNELIYRSKKGKILRGNYQIANNDGSYTYVKLTKGKLNGTKRNFDNKNKLKGIQNYKNGKPHGKWVYFNSYGEPKNIKNYVNGLKHGAWWKKVTTQYSFYIEKTFYNNDEPSGTWTKINIDSILLQEKRHFGTNSYIQKDYFINRQLQEVQSYVNGKLHGEQLLYSKAGILLKKNAFKNGVIVKKETYHKNGRPYEIYHYKNGKQHGLCIDYKSSGVKSYEGTYNTGFKEGIFKQYIGTKGWLYFETTYKNDIATGPHTTYWRNGNIKHQGEFLNSDRHGVWKFYKMNGILFREITYDRGTQISIKEF